MPSSSSCEPDRKRVRFTPPTAPSASLRAYEVVQLRYVESTDGHEAWGAANSHPENLVSTPTFLHQIIPNETVHGWQSLRVAVYVHLPTLYIWLDSHGVPLVPGNGGGNGKGDASSTPRTDVVALLAPFVKHGLCLTKDKFLAAISSPMPLPMSKRVSTYERKGNAYAVYKERIQPHPSATSNAATSEASDNQNTFLNFHLRMAFLMFIHIDGASFIDHEDPRWEIFCCVQLQNDIPSKFVGYATIYPFSALTNAKSSLTFCERIRISQVFVAPLAQQCGHGAMLLTAIYYDALKRGAIEVTVEDPSATFRVLRDVTDLKRAYNGGILEQDKDLDGKIDDVIEKLRRVLLLTPGQARRCLEVHRLRFVDREVEEQYKKYRLWVKRRLYGEYVEVLHQYDKEEKKEKLADIYDNYQVEYLEALTRLDASLKRQREQQGQRNEREHWANGNSAESPQEEQQKSAQEGAENDSQQNEEEEKGRSPMQVTPNTPTANAATNNNNNNNTATAAVAQ